MGGELFGKTAEGEPVHRHRIEGGGLTASIMEWGAPLHRKGSYRTQAFPRMVQVSWLRMADRCRVRGRVALARCTA